MNEKARQLMAELQTTIDANPLSLFQGDTLALFQDIFKELRSGLGAIETEQQHEIEFARANKKPIPCHISIKPVWYDHNWALLVSLVDLSYRIELERSKSSLITLINHELRTPLTSIIGSLSLVLSRKLGEVPAAIEELLSIASRNSDRLKHLVDEILHVDKLTCDEFLLRQESFNLVNLLNTVVADNIGYADQYGVHVVFDASAAPIHVVADEFRISQVIVNLLSNAIKHTPKDGQVKIMADCSAHYVTVNVLDAGPGIPDVFRSRLFDRFTQNEEGNTSLAGRGSGLGLHISKLIVNKHGGQIGHENVIEGSRFFFTIPLS
jgi:signal transduction histidine kinase